MSVINLATDPESKLNLGLSQLSINFNKGGLNITISKKENSPIFSQQAKQDSFKNTLQTTSLRSRQNSEAFSNVIDLTNLPTASSLLGYLYSCPHNNLS